MRKDREKTTGRIAKPCGRFTVVIRRERPDHATTSRRYRHGRLSAWLPALRSSLVNKR